MGGGSPHAVKKVLLIMKLTFLLVFVAALQVSAHVHGQDKVSLKLNEVEISKALNSIDISVKEFSNDKIYECE